MLTIEKQECQSRNPKSRNPNKKSRNRAGSYAQYQRVFSVAPQAKHVSPSTFLNGITAGRAIAWPRGFRGCSPSKSKNAKAETRKAETQTRKAEIRVVSQLFHGPAPRSPLHRLAVRLCHSRSNTSTEYSLPGATQLSQVRSISPSGQGVPCRFLPCAARAGLC